MNMLWFALGMVVGGFLGLILLALMVAAKQADERLESDNDMPAECFWCGGRMARFKDGWAVCSDCGWRYKGKESEVEEG